MVIYITETAAPAAPANSRTAPPPGDFRRPRFRHTHDAASHPPAPLPPGERPCSPLPRADACRGDPGVQRRPCDRIGRPPGTAVCRPGHRRRRRFIGPDRGDRPARRRRRHRDAGERRQGEGDDGRVCPGPRPRL